MTVDLNPFPNLNAPPLSALWPALRERRDSKRNEESGEADHPEARYAEPLSGWPRIFPGL